jgi:hypothetical protein
MEDDLFRCIGKSKRPELALDWYASAANMFFVALLLPIVFFAAHFFWKAIIIVAMWIIVWGLMSIGMLRSGLSRKER